MKRLLYSTILSAIALFAISNTSYAQNPMREVRKEERVQAEQQQEQQIEKLLEAKHFMFTATSISSTINPNMQNIQLNKLWATWVAPSLFETYLPIYGSSPMTGQPSLLRTMKFTVTNYTYKMEPSNPSGFDVTITAMDPWSTTEYTYFYQIPANGNNTVLTISTPFKPSVTFYGNISGSSIE